ncbi:hypothetical protein SLS62_007626 [Diatrype stigma]|uniref:RING-type domain-containing protein n=1 Tax=Diatrype stigma TaxID=117547 RepID=A0AAN9YQ41_9PEZI
MSSSTTATTCAVCLEPSPPLRHLACGHAYCQPDLRRLIEVALDDRALWPPRCCRGGGGQGQQQQQGEEREAGVLTDQDVHWAELPPPAYHRYCELRWESASGANANVNANESPDPHFDELMRRHNWKGCGTFATAVTNSATSADAAGKPASA